ncbi:hypothetical protein UFOVP251_57 [uncultured Caudovirales phage]|uniref:Uncharacterized protein n=1 Tax=uncultured Caudovirales phage TaxID=2100421 RepID=A0A6J5LIW6_9CAUD|nr:hypothetical protein UFOVP251_57 [uncultured Caudovirales phage]
MDKVTLSAQLFNAVTSYLATKPFQEVVQLIGAIEKEVQAQRNVEPNE